MSIVYHVYANNGAGGPVDYTTILATVSGLTYTTTALSFPGDYTFAVRAYDNVALIEETNVDARVRLVLDSSGNNVTGRPNAPTGLTALATAGGGASLAWQYNPGAQGGAPTGFHVYAGSPTPSYGSPVATVPYATGRAVFTAQLSGLTGGTTYQVVVRAYNAVAEEPNTNDVSFVAATAGPAAVDSLTGTAVP